MGPHPIAQLYSTLVTAILTRFWPLALPDDDPHSHCLDSGCAPEDILDGQDAKNAVNIKALQRPVTLGTASTSVPLTHKGDILLSNGLPSTGSYLLGTMNKSLISLSKRLRQGWGILGLKRKVILFSPEGQVYPDVDDAEGLLTPATSSAHSLRTHQRLRSTFSRPYPSRIARSPS